MYPNNPEGSIANFIVFPYDNGWELYLHEDMPKYGREIERCLAVTENISQMLEFLDKKIDGLRGNDILIDMNNTESEDMFQTYFFIVEQMDESYALFEDFGPKGREYIDEDLDIDNLIAMHKDKRMIITY